MSDLKENLKESLDTLMSISQLDIDDAHAYELAISNLEDEDVKVKFRRFKADHERHIVEVNALIKEFGGTAPEYSRDFKGFLISGYTALRSMMGTKGALEAMHTNEKMTVHMYEEALKKDLDPITRGLLIRNLEDEKEHLSFIEGVLANENWDR